MWVRLYNLGPRQKAKRLNWLRHTLDRNSQTRPVPVWTFKVLEKYNKDIDRIKLLVYNVHYATFTLYFVFDILCLFFRHHLHVRSDPHSGFTRVSNTPMII
jgi:hypothetical protein